MKNYFVNISEVNWQCLQSLGTRSEDDFEKVSTTNEIACHCHYVCLYHYKLMFQRSQGTRKVLWMCSLNSYVFVFVLVFVFWLIRSCLVISQYIGSSWIFPYILLFDKLILTKLFWRQYVWYSFLSRLKTTFQRLSDKDDKQISSIILLCLYFQFFLICLQICLQFPDFLCNTAFSYIFPSTLALSLIAVTFGGTQLQKLWLL